MIELIPAIDIIDGKCVRLSQGDYGSKKVYNEDPVEVARSFEDAGIGRLHVVDLDGAKEKHIVNHEVLRRITSRTSLRVDFGGGLKTDEDLRVAFDCGASMVTGGSVAVRNPALFLSWVEKYGNERIILGADAKNGMVAVNGWQDVTEVELVSFLQKYMDQGLKKVICTDIAKDGMLQGPSIALYREIMRKIDGVYLIASGGVSSVDDILSLESAGVPAVIFGKAIYEGRVTLSDLNNLQKRNA